MKARTTTPTRRAMLGGAIAAMAATAALVPTAGGAEGVSPELARLLEASRQADRTSDEYEAQFQIVRTKWLAACDDLPTHSASYENVVGGRHTLTSDDATAYAVARRMATLTETTEAGKAGRAIVGAFEAREAKKAKLAKAFGVDAMVTRSNQLSDASVDAIDAIAEFKVRSNADLEAKLSRLMEAAYLDYEDTRVALLADVRRLAGKGA